MTLLLKIPSTLQIRKLEAEWIAQCDSGWGQVLMEIAGRASAAVVNKLAREHAGYVAIYCGRGNNGGDGMVAARYLHLSGIPVKVFLVHGTQDANPETQQSMSTRESNTNKKIAESLGIEVRAATAEHEADMDGAGVIVDALLGTGIDRPVEGIYRNIIDSINRSGKQVVAVDLPSGIHSDTGQVMGAAVRADHTVTFGFLKTGLLCHPGCDLSGTITVVDIGLPGLPDGEPFTVLSTVEYVRSLLPQRPSDSHKGTFGTVLTIAGSTGMMGATLLSSLSALRAGAGLSLLAAPESLLACMPPGEVIYRPVSQTKQHSISPMAIKDLEPELEKARSVILGPGISQHPETVEFVRQLIAEILIKDTRPCIIDADALNAIAVNTNVLSGSRSHFVLTPHPRELSRLMDKPVSSIQADRLGAAKEAAARFDCTVVLKGSRSIIATPAGDTYINPTGNAGMATAGSGDVLSGIIGGLLSQGLPPFEAAVAGVYIHGMAGDIVASELGDAGIIAGDITEAIPLAIKGIKAGEPSELEIQLFSSATGDR